MKLNDCFENDKFYFFELLAPNRQQFPFWVAVLNTGKICRANIEKDFKKTTDCIFGFKTPVAIAWHSVVHKQKKG